MIRSSLLVTVFLSFSVCLLADPAPDSALIARAQKILREVPLVDGHNDAPWELREHAHNQLSRLDLRSDTSKLDPPMQTDLPRLRAGGVGGQFWSVYVPVELKGPEAVQAVLEQIDDVRRMTEIYPDTLQLALTADDVVRIHRSGKVASLIGVEGGHSIGDSLAVLRQLYALGGRYMTLTHSSDNDWADAATDAPKHGGLTPFGRAVVREMNRLGMLVDLSHTSDETMKQAIDLSSAPVVFTHSAARALDGHPRNVPDDVLQRLAAKRGVIMVTFVPIFISEEARQQSAKKDAEEMRLKTLLPGDPEQVKRELKAWSAAHPVPRATVQQVADHIDHIRRVAGIDSIGIGSDFDGINSTPEGLESVADYPVLLAELLRRGYSESEVKKITGLNILRVMREAEETAKRLQKESPPSDARIEELDAAAAK